MDQARLEAAHRDEQEGQEDRDARPVHISGSGT